MRTVRRGMLVLLCLGALSCAWAGSLDAEVADALALVGAEERVAVIVTMAEPTDSALAATPPPRVRAALVALADRSQRALRQQLDTWRGQGLVTGVRVLPIINGIALAAPPAVVRAIAGRADVGCVYLDRVMRLIDSSPPLDVAQATDWHLVAIKADQAWAAHGVDGSGIVIGIMDTGVNVSHPCLSSRYRGGSNSWFDAINGQTAPYDDYPFGHGTPVTGLACGNDPSRPYYGVAPGARFIAAKIFDSSGNGADSAILDAADWMLDPDEDPTTPDQPQVINNSWSTCPGRDPFWRPMIDAWLAAGVHPVFSIGNSGQAAGSACSPGDYPDLIGVGATDAANNILPASSRGPALWGGIEFVKPNLCAPGWGVPATYGGGSYSYFQGTSASCPQVAGAMALVLQRHRGMTYAELKTLLEGTAQDRGDPGPDNTYGYGLLDCLAALDQAPPVVTSLEWVSATGYGTDGVNPDSGPAGTMFAFKVLYTDSSGGAPRVHRCDIYRNECGQWVLYKKMGLTQESGSVATGAVFAGASKLPAGYPYRYQFVFRPETGPQLTWPAGAFQNGPTPTGSPRLCWTGAAGLVTDGVDPNAGAPGGKFLFKVLYTDSGGEAPTLAEVQVRRAGKIRYKRDMKPEGAALNYREGVVFRFLLPITEAGAYEYRFRFRNSAKAALGNPTAWQAGPQVTAGGAALVVTGLSAVPTAAGAQLTFTLSSAAGVTVTVLNVAGRPIRTIIADRSLEAGMQTLLWDRRADNGLAAPAGLYLLHVTARTEDGSQSNALASVRLK